MKFVVVDLENREVFTYKQGDIMTFGNEDLAKMYCGLAQQKTSHPCAVVVMQAQTLRLRRAIFPNE